MKIELGQTIQSLANVGVIAGIVFLAIEIRQNTESLEINAYQELIAQINSQSELSHTNPEASRRFNYLADLSADDLSFNFYGHDVSPCGPGSSAQSSLDRPYCLVAILQNLP